MTSGISSSRSDASRPESPRCSDTARPYPASPGASTAAENISLSSANEAAAPRPAKLPSRASSRAACRNAPHAVRASAEPTLILRTPRSVLFVIPWGRHWIVGTTDTDWDLDKAHPAASSADIDYLLEHVNSVLAVPLSRDDVQGVYAGLRPLLASVGALTVSTAVYGTDAQFQNGRPDSRLIEQLERAVAEALVLITTPVPA